jgi:hypothetical protein
MFTDVKKKTQKKIDVTILTQVVIGILDLWNASTIGPSVGVTIDGKRMFIQ